MASIKIDRLHCSATYPASKAISLASQLNCDELAEDTNYTNGEFTGLVYSAEVKDGFGRVKVSDADGIFVGYF